MLVMIAVVFHTATGVLLIADPRFVAPFALWRQPFCRLYRDGPIVGLWAGLSRESSWPNGETVTVQATSNLFTHNLPAALYIGTLKPVDASLGTRMATLSSSCLAGAPTSEPCIYGQFGRNGLRTLTSTWQRR